MSLSHTGGTGDEIQVCHEIWLICALHHSLWQLINVLHWWNPLGSSSSSNAILDALDGRVRAKTLRSQYNLRNSRRTTVSLRFVALPIQIGSKSRNAYGYTTYYVTTRTTVADRMKKNYICTNIKQNKTNTAVERLPSPWPAASHTHRAKPRQNCLKNGLIAYSTLRALIQTDRAANARKMWDSCSLRYLPLYYSR